MAYIVIEKFGGWKFATIVTDENGNNMVFDTMEEALKESDDCQDGIVVGDETILDTTLKDNLEMIRDNLNSLINQIE